MSLTRDEAAARISKVRAEIINSPHTKSLGDPSLLMLRGLLEDIDLFGDGPIQQAFVNAAERILADHNQREPLESACPRCGR